MSAARSTAARHQHKTSTTWCEVVRIDSPLFLVDAQHHARRYKSSDDKPLARGYYLVLGRDTPRNSFQDPSLRYLGPFSNRATADFLRVSAAGLGCADPESAPRPRADLFDRLCLLGGPALISSFPL